MPALRPDVAAFLDQVSAALPAVDFAHLSPDDGRQYLEESRRSLPRSAPSIDLEVVEDLTIEPGIRARRYARRDGTGAPLLVYFHGGGWVQGDLDDYDHVCRCLAARGGFTVLSVHYRLAPEHPFPAAFDDALTAVRWACEHAAELGADPARIAIGGGSAGGNLAAAVTLAARDAGGPDLAAQLLIYPVLDSTRATASYREYGEGYLISAAQLAWYWDQYVPDPADRTNPLASPRHAERLEGLPPAVVISAELDPLHDEAGHYVARLREAGVPVVHVTYAGQVHGFVNALGLLDDAEVALGAAAELLDQALAEPTERLRERWSAATDRSHLAGEP